MQVPATGNALEPAWPPAKQVPNLRRAQGWQAQVERIEWIGMSMWGVVKTQCLLQYLETMSLLFLLLSFSQVKASLVEDHKSKDVLWWSTWSYFRIP